MVRATTPTFTLVIQEETVNLTLARNVYVTLEQGNTKITKTGNDVEVETRTVKVWLAQEESIGLAENVPLALQVNWTYLDSDGVTIRRAATNVAKVNVTRQLLDEVIE